MMHEHFFHLILSLIPFILLALFYAFKSITIKKFHLVIFISLFSFISFHAFPLHSAHAVLMADQVSHECCLPAFVTPVVAFHIELPEMKAEAIYSYKKKLVESPLTFFYFGRSPPSS